MDVEDVTIPFRIMIKGCSINRAKNASVLVTKLGGYLGTGYYFLGYYKIDDEAQT